MCVCVCVLLEILTSNYSFLFDDCPVSSSQEGSLRPLSFLMPQYRSSVAPRANTPARDVPVTLHANTSDQHLDSLAPVDIGRPSVLSNTGALDTQPPLATSHGVSPHDHVVLSSPQHAVPASSPHSTHSPAAGQHPAASTPVPPSRSQTLSRSASSSSSASFHSVCAHSHSHAVPSPHSDVATQHQTLRQQQHTDRRGSTTSSVSSHSRRSSARRIRHEAPFYELHVMPKRRDPSHARNRPSVAFVGVDSPTRNVDVDDFHEELTRRQSSQHMGAFQCKRMCVH